MHWANAFEVHPLRGQALPRPVAVVSLRRPCRGPARSRWRVAWLLAAFLWSVLAVAQACSDLDGAAERLLQMRNSDPAAAVEEGSRLLQVAEVRSPRCREAEVRLLVATGNNLHVLGRLQEAIARFQDALQRMPEDAPAPLRAAVHRGFGVVLSDAWEFVSAQEHYLRALEAAEESGDVLEIAKTAGNIGNLYNAIDEYELARDYHRRALQGFETAGFREGIAGTHINLGAVALKLATVAQKSGDSARNREMLMETLAHEEQALVLFAELGTDRGVGQAEANIAKVLFSLGRHDEAVEHRRRALELHERVGFRQGLNDVRLALGEDYIELGRYDEALAELEQVARAREELTPSRQSDLASALGRLYERRGQYEQAIEQYREVIRLAPVLYDEEYPARIRELQARYDTEKQAREIELLRSQAKLRELELWRQRMVLAAAVVVVLVVIVILAVVYSRLRLGQRVARELERAARTDPLTGLANRRHMMELIVQTARASEQGGPGFAVIMVDVDGFKSINDHHGHGVGDLVLQEVARRLSSRLRHDDLLARWGGEEFLVLLPDTDAERGRRVAEDLCRVVSASPMDAGRVTLHLAISVGVCGFAAGMGVDECITRADQAMYAAKRQGGNRVGDIEDGVGIPA